MTDTTLSIILGILSVVVTIFGYYMSIKKKVQEEALKAINSAEDLDTSGEKKMEFAVDTVCSIIPVMLKPFIGRDVVEMLIQVIFDQVEEFAKKQVK